MVSKRGSKRVSKRGSKRVSKKLSRPKSLRRFKLFGRKKMNKTRKNNNLKIIPSLVPREQRRGKSKQPEFFYDNSQRFAGETNKQANNRRNNRLRDFKRDLNCNIVIKELKQEIEMLRKQNIVHLKRIADLQKNNNNILFERD